MQCHCPLCWSTVSFWFQHPCHWTFLCFVVQKIFGSTHLLLLVSRMLQESNKSYYINITLCINDIHEFWTNIIISTKSWWSVNIASGNSLSNFYLRNMKHSVKRSISILFWFSNTPKEIRKVTDLGPFKSQHRPIDYWQSK